MRPREPWALLATLASLWQGCATPAQAFRRTPLEEARAQLAEGDPREAYAELHALWLRAPLDLDVTRTLAEAAVKTQRTDALLTEARTKNATHETAAGEYLVGLLEFARRADAHGPAQEAFSRALTLAPTVAELHYRLGVALLESEAYGEALEPLNLAVQLAPDRATLRLPLAKARARTGDRRGAVQAIREALAAGPTAAEVTTAQRLMDALENPYGVVPRAAQGRLETALEALNADSPQGAILALEDVSRDFPDLAVGHELLGLAYEKLDDPARAVEELQRAIQIAPDLGKTYLELGQIYLAHQRLEVARECFEKALEHNPTLEEPYASLSELAMARHDLPGARRLLTTLTYLRPADAGVRVKLADTLLQDGDWAGAQGALREGLRRAPQSIELMLQLGLLEAELQAQARTAQERRTAAAEAVLWLKRVLDLQPENALASRALQSLSGTHMP